VATHACRSLVVVVGLLAPGRNRYWVVEGKMDEQGRKRRNIVGGAPPMYPSSFGCCVV